MYVSPDSSRGEQWPPLRVGLRRAGPPVRRWTDAEFGTEGGSISSNVMGMVSTDMFDNTMFPFTGPFYMIDGSNLFYRGSDKDTHQRQWEAVHTALRNQGGKRLPVVVIAKKENLPDVSHIWNDYQNKLQHLVENKVSSLPNVYIIGVDLSKCTGPNLRNCMHKGESKSVFKDKCEYVPSRSVDKHRFPIPGSPFKYEEAPLPPGAKHLYCEYDDVLFSGLFWKCVPSQLHGQVEIVSSDQSVVKSPQLVDHSLKLISSMRIPVGASDDVAINYTTYYYAVNVVASPPWTQALFLGSSKFIQRHWGVRLDLPARALPARAPPARAPSAPAPPATGLPALILPLLPLAPGELPPEPTSVFAEEAAISYLF